MKQLPLCVLAGVLIFGAWGTAQADPIAQATQIHIDMAGQLADANEGYGDADSSWTGFHDMDKSCSAATISGSGSSINFFGEGAAHFDSASQGDVSFSNLGFSRVIFDRNETGWATLSNSFWSYTFVTQEPAKLEIRCNTTLDDAATDAEGLQGFAVTVSQGDQVVYDDAMGVGEHGKMKVRLEPGQTYTLTIAVQADLSASYGFGLSAMDADFAWTIKPTKK